MGLQPGARFGRYEMVSRLGQGGMAETYRARLVGEAGVTKPVLIKKVLPEYANDDAFTTMFVSEARISATLSHGNIAQVYDFGRVDGEYFLAMEFVDGQPLHKILKRALRNDMSSLPIPIAAFIGIEMCRGLHYAHTRTDQNGKPLGIVHRDISPDNVLISYEGQVKIVDFGIAKARELRGFNTEPGVVKGKYLFFSPEQARGKEVDARTDVWATGVVLYEMFCGQLPVKGPSYVAMPLLVQGKFPRPREINPELPRELDDIVMQALAVDPDERLASCHELGDALAGFLYSAEPRFSAMSLSHFLHQLFREELQSEGRQVQVPRSFLEQMERWSLATVPTNPVRKAAYTPTPPETPAVVAREPRKTNVRGSMVAPQSVTTNVREKVVAQEPQPRNFRDDSVQEGMEEELVEEGGSSSTGRWLYVGGGIGVAVLAILIVMAVMGEQPAHDPSALRPLFPKEESAASPPRAVVPAVEKTPSADSRPAPEAQKPVQEVQKPVQEVQTPVKEAEEPAQEAPPPQKATALAQPGRSLKGPSVRPAPPTPHPPPGVMEESASAQADAEKLIRSKQFEEARKRASRCIELTPDNAECQLYKGLSYAHENQWGAAMPFLKKFLELAPDHKLAPRIRESLKKLEENK